MLYTRCARNGRNLLIRTPISVNVEKWNDCGKDLLKYCGNGTDGAKILDKANIMTATIRDCVAENKTSKEINNTLRVVLDYDARKLQQDANKAAKGRVLPYLDSFITDAAGDAPAQRKNGGEVFAPQTIDKYKTARKHLTAYLINIAGENAAEFTFADIDKPFANGFTNYLRGEGLLDATINCNCRIMSALCNRAAADGVNENAVSLRVWRQLSDNTTRPKITLTNEEIDALYNLPLYGKDAQRRDTFMLGVLTGQRYSDYSRISPEMLITLSNGGQAIELVQKKTKERVIIPLSIDERISVILARRTILNESAVNFFQGLRRIMQKLSEVCPTLCEEVSVPLSIKERNEEIHWQELRAKKANKGLNESELSSYYKMLRAARIRGLQGDKNGLLWRRDKDGNAIKPRWELVTPHTARRTFVTLAIEEKVPDAAIMQITGHKKIKTMKIYDKAGKEFHAIQAAEAFAAARNTAKPTIRIKSIS